jgi:hypothetical protein
MLRSMARTRTITAVGLAVSLAGATVCGGKGAGGETDAESGEGSGDGDGGGEGEGEGDGEGDGDGEGSGDTKFDLQPLPDLGDGPPVDQCKVVDDMDAVGDCEQEAPPDSFEPDIQWQWFNDEHAERSCLVTPMVANLTDDDENGEIDLCDVPDVVVVATTSHITPGHVYLLDGETGALHFQIPTAVIDHVAPGIGDLDGDGVPEIVTVGVDEKLVCFEHDGTVAWIGDTVWDDGKNSFLGSYAYGSISLADVDNDGDVELIAGNMLVDHLGKTEWVAPEPAGDWNASTAADLDDDGDQEIVLGHAAYHDDGTAVFVQAGIVPGFPQVADLDDDGEPEVLVTNRNGISLLENDGTIVYQDQRPTGVAAGGLNWIRPATIHDFDGDQKPEFAVSSQTHYTVYEADASIVWDAAVVDYSGVAGGTAFDFLGDGIAEAMYTDEQRLFIFDGMGQVLLQVDRYSATGTEYPVVADIDDDGSAEIVITSQAQQGQPVIQAIRDVEDRWIQARRIWNQHAYHVTNVREDGTIPQFEPPAWESLNTFRTNAQIEGGGICLPPPPG